MKVRVYVCMVYDEVRQTWKRSRYKYTLDEIAGFAHAQPVMDDWEEVDRLTPDEQRRNMTGGGWRK